MSSDAFAALAQKLLDSISIIKGPIFVGLSVLGSLYFWDMNPFGVFTFLGRPSWILPILFLLWLLFGAFCLFDIAGRVGQCFKSLMKRRTDRRRIYEKLEHHLTPDQETILAQMLLPRHDRHYFPHNELVTDLVQSGIMDQKDILFAGLRDDPQHNYIARYLCILSPVARAYLKKHSYILPKVEVENGTYVIKRKNTPSSFMLGPVEDEYGLLYDREQRKEQKKQKRFVFF